MVTRFSTCWDGRAYRKGRGNMATMACLTGVSSFEDCFVSAVPRLDDVGNISALLQRKRQENEGLDTIKITDAIGKN